LKLADTLVDDFDVIEVLSMLSGRCVEMLDAAATGILVVDANDDLQVMAASSEEVSVLELFQVQSEEGPCLDAFRSGQAVIHEDLRGPNPWGRFSTMATGAGFLAVQAFPMVVRSKVLGTMNLFMSRPGSLGVEDVIVAQALAQAATLTLLQNQAAEDSHRLMSQLQGALNSRVTIEQAKGVVSELGHIGTDEAFLRLRSYARRHNAKLTDVAADVVRRTLPEKARSELFRALSSPPPPRP